MIRYFCDYKDCHYPALMGEKGYDFCDGHWELWLNSDKSLADMQRMGYPTKVERPVDSTDSQANTTTKSELVQEIPTNDSELEAILENLLEDHVNMYSQDRESSAALGADLEVAKTAINRLLIKRALEELKSLMHEYQQPLRPGKVGSVTTVNYGVLNHDTERRIAILQAELKRLEQK